MKAEMESKSSNKLLTSRVSEFLLLNNKIKCYSERKAKIQDEIISLLQSLKSDSAVVSVARKEIGEDYCFIDEDAESGKCDISCKVVRTSKIIFDVQSVIQKIGKKRSSKFIDSDIRIINMDGMAELMKAHGVPFSEFKKLVSVSKSVNLSKLETMNQLGEVSQEELEGCYEIKHDRQYVKVSAMKDGK